MPHTVHTAANRQHMTNSFLPCAMVHVSVVGPVTAPPEILLTSTFTADFAFAASVTAFQLAAGSATRAGFELPKKPW